MTNEEMLEILNKMKKGLLNKATGGIMDDNEYGEFRKIIINEPKFKNCDISFIKSNMSPNEFFRYIQGMFDCYKERRTYITNKINALINVFQWNKCLSKNWLGKIDESINYLLEDLDNISDRIDINENGVRCRETIIMLANMVYGDFKHHPFDI